MLALKRAFLLIMLVLGPAVLTMLSYRAAEFVLVRTHRVIDPGILQLVTVCEFILFFLVAVLEVRARWAARPHD